MFVQIKDQMIREDLIERIVFHDPREGYKSCSIIVDIGHDANSTTNITISFTNDADYLKIKKLL